MDYRENMQLWVREAVGELGGRATILEVAKELWSKRENDLRQAGDAFYLWQYDMRWAAQKLREKGSLGLEKVGSKSVWTLKH
jgi:hypothetical protein